MRKENNIEDAYEDLKDETGEIGKDAANNLKEVTSKLSDNAKDVGSKLCNFVEENPWKALGISFGIGFLIAKFANKGLDRK